MNPQRDIDTVGTELLLKDLETVQRSTERAVRQAKSGARTAREQHAFYEALARHLGSGQPARTMMAASGREQHWLEELFLLSSRSVLYAANVDEDSLPGGNVHAATVRSIAAQEGACAITICADFEAQLVELGPAERQEFLEAAGIRRPGLERLIKAAYNLLGLITFFTHGPKETRAWTTVRGTKAPRAARQIHTDFERGFIRAETTDIESFITLGSESAVRAAGAMRSEGKNYVVRDGDVILFRFNV